MLLIVTLLLMKTACKYTTHDNCKMLVINTQSNLRFVHLIFTDLTRGAKNGLLQDAILKYLFQNLREVSQQGKLKPALLAPYYRDILRIFTENHLRK